ncbi:MAG: Lrp/AsnC family transcriptional regulator [Deltaproteobacteria bacterium]|nr:Lrp/AsnC family transcriptional regulator [Deltaproteobacteria bacterium]
MGNFTETEKKIISALQKDIPVASRPYKIMARRLKISEETFLKVLKELSDKKIIRRFGATLWHQKSGFSANAMCAWEVKEDRAEEVGKKFASFKEITHCYKRIPQKDWHYNLYTMIHSKDEKGCIATAKKLSKAVGIEKYELLFSVEELKKTSMQYF